MEDTSGWQGGSVSRSPVDAVAIQGDEAWSLRESVACQRAITRTFSK
jgi:hypothetical protein